MQSFEPNGVFARNLKECLKIQLINENDLDPKKEIIIDNIDLLGSGDIKGLQKLTGLKEERLKDEIRIIRALNPKPGSKYSTDNDNIFHPDVIVTKNNSNWAVELNHGTLPKININEDYVKEIERLQCGESDKKFINESQNTLSLYTRLWSSVRGENKVALSDKMTLVRNAIYVNSKVTMMPGSINPVNNGLFYSGSMRNIICSIGFIDGTYGTINYNIFEQS